jgi:YHS domain-containing protein
MIRKPSLLLGFYLIVLLVSGVILAGLAQASGMGTGVEDKNVQKTCPVMVGNKIDPNLYTEYRGKKVYFCCQKCKDAFEANPEKYLHRLPQFETGPSEGVESSAFHPGALIEPLGLTTLSLLSVTFCLGFFMKKKPRVMFTWHRRLACVTIVVALCHATLVMLSHNL